MKRKKWVEEVRYFKCPYCGLVGMEVPVTDSFKCRIRFCRGVIEVNKHEVTKEDYDRAWG
jgi:hypothetical protein